MPIKIFDGHNDVVQRLREYRPDGIDFLEHSTTGHLDLPRAQAGGMFGGIFALGVLFDRLVPPYHSWEHDLRQNLVSAVFLPLLIIFIQRRFEDQRR